MEVTLLQYFESEEELIETCFNPCFYGSYSFTLPRLELCHQLNNVLILVFMEVTLLPNAIKISSINYYSFNPCFYGSYSFTLKSSFPVVKNN